MSHPIDNQSPVTGLIGIALAYPMYFVSKLIAMITISPDQFTAWLVALCGGVLTVCWTGKSVYNLFKMPIPPHEPETYHDSPEFEAYKDRMTKEGFKRRGSNMRDVQK